jgi:hypothetical protein
MGDDAPPPPKRRPGRPAVADENRRTISVTMFVSVSEYDALYRAARRAEVSISALVRAPFTDPRDR